MIESTLTEEARVVECVVTITCTLFSLSSDTFLNAQVILFEVEGANELLVLLINNTLQVDESCSLPKVSSANIDAI